MQSWLLVKTQPNRERYAQANIERWAKKETYLPLYEDAGKSRVLFPSYLFVNSDNWYFLRGAWGVAHVIMSGREPARLHACVVDELRSRADNDGLIRLPKVDYRMGQRLSILSGPFAHWVGLYHGMDSRERVRVLLDVLGRKVAISVPRTSVSAAG